MDIYEMAGLATSLLLAVGIAWQSAKIEELRDRLGRIERFNKTGRWGK